IYNIFETAGGERIFIGVVTEGHWQSFCREFGLTEFLDDPALRTTTDRILARGRIIPRAAGIIRQWDMAKLSQRLDALNICFSPINRPEDLFADPHVLRPGGLVKKIPSTDAKQRWVREEYAAGVRHFEVGSFLPAKTFPQFVDVRDVVATVAALPDAHGIALALNERGVNEALESGVGEIASVVSATEEHSQANANRSRESA